CWTTLRLDCAAVTPANGRRSPHRTDFATDCCKVSACCGGQLVEKRQRGPLSQTSLCDLERAAEESLDAGEDRRSGEERPRARAVDAEVRRDLPDRSFRELAQGGLELALAELRANDAAKRTRRAAGCEHAERKRRRELGQRVRDNLPRGGDLRLIRWVAAESATRQPERSDVDRARPRGAPRERADDELRRAAADVADRDGLRKSAGRRDRAVPGERAFILRAEDVRVDSRRLLDRLDELGAVDGLAARGGDQDLDGL